MKGHLKSIIDGMVLPQLSSITPYPAGKPISELERELGLKNIIKMASNENPFGPSPEAIKALTQELANIFRYPDGNCYELKRKLSLKFHLKSENFIIGNGSNEIIELLIRAFVRPGEEVIMADPSFIVYRTATIVVGGKPVFIKLKNFSYNLETMLNAINKKTRMVIIDNPNNPTGIIVKKQELDAFVKNLPENVILVLDEAYREFVQDSDYPGELDYIGNGKPVVVLRTFSKAYGLAGLRIGYGITDECITDYLNRLRQPFNVNFAAQIAAVAALDDNEHIRKTVENNRDGMNFIIKSMTEIGLRCVPSQSNFILVELPVDAEVMYKEMLKRGIILRSMKGYGLPDYIRITIGLPEDNKRVVREIKSILDELGK
jgi:histidinol-phosphate aminotransferase